MFKKYEYERTLNPSIDKIIANEDGYECPYCGFSVKSFVESQKRSRHDYLYAIDKDEWYVNDNDYLICPCCVDEHLTEFSNLYDRMVDILTAIKNIVDICNVSKDREFRKNIQNIVLSESIEAILRRVNDVQTYSLMTDYIDFNAGKVLDSICLVGQNIDEGVSVWTTKIRTMRRIESTFKYASKLISSHPEIYTTIF